MKTDPRHPLIACLAMLAFTLQPACHAGSGDTAPVANASTPDSSGITTSYDLTAQSSFMNGEGFDHNGHAVGSISELDTSARFVMSPELPNGTLLRLGAFYNRYSLALPENIALPNTLQAAGLVLGGDMQFDSILLRVEADPGSYGDNHPGGRSFNVPFIVGGAYIVSPDLQWILGVSVDFNRPWVVIPAPGVRWRMGSQWVLNAVLPQPEIEYEWTPSLTLHAGADMTGDTFRVAHNFGDNHGNPSLNNAILTTEEVHLIVGANWQIKQTTLRVDAGYAVYRKFDFHRADTGFQNSNGAAYIGVSLETKF